MLHRVNDFLEKVTGNLRYFFIVTGTFSHTFYCTRTLFNNSLKKLQKNSNICEPSTHNVVSMGTNIAKKYGFPCTLWAV